MINNRSSGFTLVETIIAAGVFTLFFGAALGLFFQSQRTINRVSWNNSVTQDAGLALRNFSELAKTSSYPSTVRNNLIKVADTGEDFKAKLPSGTGLIKYSGTDRTLLAFPVCKEQTETEPGTIKWASVWLEKSDLPGFSDLVLYVSSPTSFNPGAPDFAANLSTGKYQPQNKTGKRFVMLRQVETAEISIKKVPAATINMVFRLSYPDQNSLAKEIKFSQTLNVSFAN